jgi:beta-mannosidase
MTASKRIDITDTWQYRAVSSDASALRQSGDRWERATVPGNIHLDLIANGIISDPWYRDNERRQQWIGEADWEYRTRFEVPADIVESEHVEIIFEGLDTYADVYLNGSLIGSADNMYRGWKFDCKPHMTEGLNELRIHFHSVIKKTLPLHEQNGFEYPANNSQPEPKLSMYSRKPGYHFGWDWGPRLLTCGIWRPVYLHAWNDVRFDAGQSVQFIQISLTDDLATLRLSVELTASADASILLALSSIQHAFQPVTKRASLAPGTDAIAIDFEIASPRRWWCRGLGEAFLYDLHLEVFQITDNTIEKRIAIGSWEGRVGLRTIELAHEEDEHGRSFYFKLNGVPVFIKGSNCIPADYFIPRVTDKMYRRLLNDAAAANMNMLRLWGGAVYEEERFYELCDETGIMVWQDFMFACAMYPADNTMAGSIQSEAEYNIRRLRNHPCLALWCGNNEIDEGWHTWGWQERYGYTEKTCDTLWEYYRKIFHEILPDAVRRFDPNRPYWSSSPKYGFTDMRSRTDGDMHYWGVWFLNHPRENFREYLPRFMSEYGLQSMPELKTIESFTEPADRDLSSDVMQAHQRQYPNPRKGQMLGGYDMMVRYLKREYHAPERSAPDYLERLAYVSQLLQADYLRYAIETHRRAMPYCMGTMYWQLNDLWPVVSWSTVDYYGRWKAAHYAVRDAYRPLIASTEDDGTTLQVWIVNDLQRAVDGTLDLQLMTFDGTVLYRNTLTVTAPPNKSVRRFSIDTSTLAGYGDHARVVWTATLSVAGGFQSDHRHVHYFVPANRLKLEEPVIDHRVEKTGDAYRIVCTCRRLAKNVFIQTGADGMISDNYFDLLPGNEKIVIFRPEGEWDGEMKLLHYYMFA